MNGMQTSSPKSGGLGAPMSGNAFFNAQNPAIAPHVNSSGVASPIFGGQPMGFGGGGPSSLMSLFPILAHLGLISNSTPGAVPGAPTPQSTPLQPPLRLPGSAPATTPPPPTVSPAPAAPSPMTMFGLNSMQSSLAQKLGVPLANAGQVVDATGHVPGTNMGSSSPFVAQALQQGVQPANLANLINSNFLPQGFV